jgi:hypothetical protein
MLFPNLTRATIVWKILTHIAGPVVAQDLGAKPVQDPEG